MGIIVTYFRNGLYLRRGKGRGLTLFFLAGGRGLYSGGLFGSEFVFQDWGAYIREDYILNFTVSNEEILDIINSLENKSTGPSSIPLKLLSLIPDLIIIPLAFIINVLTNRCIS